MISNFKNSINTYLKKKGFSAPIQKVLKFNAALVFLLFSFGLMALPLDAWLFWLSCGALLSFWNFFFLAYFVQNMFSYNVIDAKNTRNFMIKQIFLSNLRLFITGFFLYAFLVMWSADPFALIIGLSIPLAMIPVLLINKQKNTI